jgi:hypothetical protein
MSSKPNCRLAVQIVLCLVLSSCGALNLPQVLSPADSPPLGPVGNPDEAGAGTANAVQALLATPWPLDVLFSDDFSDPLSGWDVRRDPDAVTDYLDGEFVILVGKPDTALWSKPNRYMTDVSVEVDAREVAGPDDNLFGVICRYQDSDNFYRLVIAGNGYAGITKRAGGTVSVISGPHLAISNAVQRGQATNHIQAICLGNQLTLYVNGELVAQATDGDFTAGDTGLLAAAGKHPGIEIHFSSYLVKAP